MSLKSMSPFNFQNDRRPNLVVNPVTGTKVYGTTAFLHRREILNAFNFLGWPGTKRYDNEQYPHRYPYIRELQRHHQRVSLTLELVRRLGEIRSVVIRTIMKDLA